MNLIFVVWRLIRLAAASNIIYFGIYSASDSSNPPPAMSNSPVQPVAEGRSPRKANPIRATNSKLRRSMGTTNDASPCFKALKKQNEDRPLAMPERVMNTQVCCDSSNGLLHLPVAMISNGKNIDMTTVRIRVARSASMFSSPTLPSTAEALAKIAESKAHVSQRGRAGNGLI